MFVRYKDSGEFVGPTAAELVRLIYPTPDNLRRNEPTS